MASTTLFHPASWGVARDVPNRMQSRARYRSPGQPWPGANKKQFFQIGLDSKKWRGATATSDVVSSEETAVVFSTQKRSLCFPGNRVKMNSGKHELLRRAKPLATRPGIRAYFWSGRQQRLHIQCRITTTLPSLSIVAAGSEQQAIWSGCMCYLFWC